MCVCFRLHSAVQAKQKDKQTLGQLEKRLKAEQEARAAAERQLAEEKKRKKLEEATAARAVALAAASRYMSCHYSTSFILTAESNELHLFSLYELSELALVILTRSVRRTCRSPGGSTGG